ncbi:hypothetical protein [Pseudonocardia lacus]|nr:hypothetical protein [Pseudonocardia lacus]
MVGSTHGSVVRICEWIRDLRARASAAECRVVDLDPDLTGVEWCVELDTP